MAGAVEVASRRTGNRCSAEAVAAERAGRGDVLLTESHRNRLTVEDQSVRIIDEDFASFRRIPPNTCFAVNEVNNEFRRRPSCLIIGILLAIEFCVLGAGSVFVSAWNIDGSFTYSLQTAVFMGLFWGAAFIVSLLMIAAAYRERLTFSATSISQQRVFWKSTLQFNNIVHLQWHHRPKGGYTVRLCTSDQRITINLRNFTDEDQRTIASLLRSAVAEAVQEEWARSAQTEPTKHWAVALLCGLLFAATGGIFVHCSSFDMGFHWFPLGVGNIAASFWYLWRIRTFVSCSHLRKTA